MCVNVCYISINFAHKAQARGFGRRALSTVDAKTVEMLQAAELQAAEQRGTVGDRRFPPQDFADPAPAHKSKADKLLGLEASATLAPRSPASRLPLDTPASSADAARGHGGGKPAAVKNGEAAPSELRSNKGGEAPTPQLSSKAGKLLGTELKAVTPLVKRSPRSSAQAKPSVLVHRYGHDGRGASTPTSLPTAEVRPVRTVSVALNAGYRARRQITTM